MMINYSLTRLPGHYAVCLLPPTAPIPPWAAGGDFLSITRTADELSIICAQDALPREMPEAQPELQEIARDWVVLRVEGHSPLM